MGAMLQTPYLEKMLLGQTVPRARPWLDMRMPSFPLTPKTSPTDWQHNTD